MKILIIEDEEILQKVLKEKFEKEGFKVMITDDRERAIPITKKFEPDVILLDIILPKSDGFTILSDLMADAKLKAIPVVVLSNLGQDEEIKRALSMGAVEYLVKTQHPIKEVIEKVKAVAIKPK